MQEVFEKIIEKLEERKQFHKDMIAYELYGLAAVRSGGIA